MPVTPVSQGRPARTLRLRASASSPPSFLPGGTGEVARLALYAHETVEPGEPIAVEVSLGPLADEVVLEGSVCGAPTSSGARKIVVALGEDQTERVRYIKAVLEGSRQASARRDRRVGVDMPVVWRSEGPRVLARAQNLSRRGVFILSRSAPPVGTRVVVELRPPEELPPLQLEGVVTWTRRGELEGFGLRFALPDRKSAADMAELVKRWESR